MTQVIICKVEDKVNRLLIKRATMHGLSVEEEVGQILRCAVTETDQTQKKLGSRIAARFKDIGLTEPLTELHGHALEPVNFGS
ncbi:toxin-antitoxin system [Chlorobium sp. BLA1]|uniref:FitA-like ribbon-helix-helix domain-containing protein n=1 Tax=Candidatus Chlorobium masyuteum TaxID=2716876 RepID=UPI0014244F47|nr:toxin-antitoxin system [Candidatus Chlorobium masyuteum]NHQ60152.1 toxin-antitoxin system [Candidatus Chlorobium masyuteum]